MKKTLFALTMLAWVMCGGAWANSPEKGADLVGKPVPVFETTDIAGEKLSSARFGKSGQIVLVNFWGLRCGACLEEMRYLNALYEKYKDSVRFLGVNVDSVDRTILAAQIAKAKIDIRYTVIPDPDFVLVDSFKMLAAPLTLLVDKAGIVRYRHENFEPGDEKKLEEALKRVIEGKDPEIH